MLYRTCKCSNLKKIKFTYLGLNWKATPQDKGNNRHKCANKQDEVLNRLAYKKQLFYYFYEI